MNMMQTQSQVPPALQVLMSMGAQPTAPGPMGQPIPTIASQKAEQAAGVQTLMPGVQQQAMNMAQAQQPVRMGELPPQLQQAIQQSRSTGGGLAGLPAPNMSFADGGVVGYSGEGPSFVQNLSDAEIERLTPEQRKAYYKELLSRRNAPMPTPPTPSGPTVSPRAGLGVAGAMARKLGPLGLLAELFTTSDEDIATLERAEAARKAAAAPAAAPVPAPQTPAPTPAQRVIGNAPPMSAEAQAMVRRQLPPMTETVQDSSPPLFNLDPNNPQALNALRRMATQTSGVERQAILNKIAELEAAQPSRSMLPEAAGPGIPAALPPRATIDRASVETAGSQYGAQTAERIKRMQEIERQRAEAVKGMPDLSAEGIAALEEANRARQEMLAKQRADDKFNRRMGLYREMSGRDTDAYNRTVAAQQARDQAAAQAELMHRQAVLKLREAQQAKQLGQFDRALAFEKEAAELENKANDFKLRAQQIATQMATSEFSGIVSMRGQDMQAQQELKRMAPAEQMMAERAINDWLSKNPGKSYSDAVEWYKTIGNRQPTDRSVITYDQAADNVSKFLDTTAGMMEVASIRKRAKDAGQPEPSIMQIREMLIQRELQGGGRAPATGASSTGGQPIYARNPSTGARIMSTDGGQTWKPVQ